MCQMPHTVNETQQDIQKQWFSALKKIIYQNYMRTQCFCSYL